MVALFVVYKNYNLLFVNPTRTGTRKDTWSDEITLRCACGPAPVGRAGCRRPAAETWSAGWGSSVGSIHTLLPTGPLSPLRTHTHTYNHQHSKWVHRVCVYFFFLPLFIREQSTEQICSFPPQQCSASQSKQFHTFTPGSGRCPLQSLDTAGHCAAPLELSELRALLQSPSMEVVEEGGKRYSFTSPAHLL